MVAKFNHVNLTRGYKILENFYKAILLLFISLLIVSEYLVIRLSHMTKQFAYIILSVSLIFKS